METKDPGDEDGYRARKRFEFKVFSSRILKKEIPQKVLFYFLSPERITFIEGD